MNGPHTEVAWLGGSLHTEVVKPTHAHPHGHWKTLRLPISDVARASIEAPVRRQVCVELRDEPFGR